VLCYGGYPLAVIEITGLGVSPESKVDQLDSYLDRIDVGVGYVITRTRGTDFQIAKVDRGSGQVTISENLPTPDDLLESAGFTDTTDPRLYPFYALNSQ